MTAAEPEWLAWYQAGVTAGYEQGRADAEREMAEAWTPVAERVRASAGHASWAQLVAARGEHQAPDGSYRTNPVPGDHAGGPVTWPDPVKLAGRAVEHLRAASEQRRTETGIRTSRAAGLADQVLDVEDSTVAQHTR